MKKGYCQTNWTTYDGRQVSLSEIDHSHLSNSYWYIRIFQNIIPINILEELERRFGGEILEYNPIIDWEIKELNKMGLVVHGVDGARIIVYEKNRIGRIK